MSVAHRNLLRGCSRGKTGAALSLLLCGASLLGASASPCWLRSDNRICSFVAIYPKADPVCST